MSDDPRLIELEAYLLDEQQRAEKCEDPETKILLERRCLMWAQCIADILSESEVVKEDNST